MTRFNLLLLMALIAGGHVPNRPLQTITEWEDFVRAEARPGLHPCGTCRMGQDAMSVTDPLLRVHQAEGLRIADASVMPNVISGNLNAVCVMIGERAADILRTIRSGIITVDGGR